MRVGQIGLGNMGRAVAERIIASGQAMVVWNRTEERADGLAAPIAANPADLVNEVDVVILCLFDSKTVDLVMNAKDGLFAADLQRKLVIDLTTNSPAKVGEFHEQVKAHKGMYLEAPALGSTNLAHQGMLTLLISGERIAFESALPVLKRIARDLFFLGQPGRASQVKLINNMVLGASMIALGEAVALGERAGLDRERMLEILGRGAGNSAVLNSVQERLVQDDFLARFSVAAMHKDLCYLEEMARDLRRPLFIGNLCRQIYAEAIGHGQGELDYSVVYETLKDL